MSKKCLECKMPNPDTANRCVYCGVKLPEVYFEETTFDQPSQPINYHSQPQVKTYSQRKYKNPYENVRYGKMGEIIYPNPLKGLVKFLIVVFVIGLIAYYSINLIQDDLKDKEKYHQLPFPTDEHENKNNEKQDSLPSGDDGGSSEIVWDDSINNEGIQYYDDDGERDDKITIDFYDDYIEKSIDIDCSLENVYKATLQIYGCFSGEYVGGDSHKITINNNSSIYFNPYHYFNVEDYDWGLFNIPLNCLKNGKNLIYIDRESTQSKSGYDSWQINKLRIGIDTDNDNGNSYWYSNYGKNPDVDGELMIRLKLN